MALPYTDEDVWHCARTLFGAEFRSTDEAWSTLSEDDRESYRRVIRYVLADLAARGRLRNPGERPDQPHALDLLVDLIAKCTEYGDQDGGFVAAYLLPTGPVHRAIPFLDSIGIPARPGFDPRSAASDSG